MATNKIGKLELPPELVQYLRKRALRSGRTLQETLESLIRETMTYDELVGKMGAPAPRFESKAAD